MARYSQFAPEHLLIPGRGPAPQSSLADLPHRPYTYQGNGTTVPDVQLQPTAIPAPAWAALCLHDTPLTAVDAPLSAPPEWHRELAQETP